MLSNEKARLHRQPGFFFDPYFYFSGLGEIVGQLNYTV
jgi:hypothetical protein